MVTAWPFLASSRAITLQMIPAAPVITAVFARENFLVKLVDCCFFPVIRGTFTMKIHSNGKTSKDSGSFNPFLMVFD
jgi:hypothetical protein